MLAYLVLLFAVLSRLLPHAVHASAWNFTAVGGGLLFFGSRMAPATPDQPGSARRPALMLASALAVLMLTDYFLTVAVYHFSFALRGYLVTWAWYALVCLLGMGLLNKTTALRVTAGVLASATSFYILVDFALWAGGTMYPHTLAGLEACYVAAIPFYRNDLISTALTAGALFGLPALATRLVENLRPSRSRDLAA